MKIGIDARMYGSGFGLARYTQQCIHHLLKIDSDYQYVLFVKKNHAALSSYIKEHSITQVRLVVVDIPWYSLKEQLCFKKIIQKESVDLMHFPHWNIPLFYNDPFVVTIHDLIMYHYPRPEATTLGPITFWIKDQIHRRVVRHAVGKAKHIFVTSEFTKHDVHTTLQVPLDKMTVTYQAPFVSAKSDVSASAVLKKYGITKPFALYVGSAYPHKNLDTLVDAWKQYIAEYEEDRQLVLVGKESYFYDRLQKKIKDDFSIIYTGFVEDDELTALYTKSDLYIFLSLYEGFGLPPLEALSHGVPVIASNRSCLPEVLGEAALYVDPKEVSQIVDVMHTGFTDEHIRHDIRQNAKKELLKYSWSSLAKKTQDIYDRVGRY
jgi:glycosyltransferase involved in cell wall biosynthesis